MSKKITNKKPQHINDRSKALNSTKRKQGLNMQKATLPDGTKIITTVREAKKYRKNETKVEK